MTHWHALLLIGISCGVLSALFGIGSGLVLVPLLTVFLHVQQKPAQAMSLAVMAPMALAGLSFYLGRQKVAFDLPTFLLLASGGVAGAFLGSLVVEQVSGQVLRRLFAVLMVVVAARMFFAPERPPAAAVSAAPAAAGKEP